uniref:Uncharacterized protein n=1 Tax=uncultured bacterium A1Q1_fos_1050 TaxID=1256538 RepID=L7VV94_9BACT|nr:hypothetical protein [uncultured bacterium A1Q1_fos_1050]
MLGLGILSAFHRCASVLTVVDARARTAPKRGQRLVRERVSVPKQEQFKNNSEL